MSRRISETMESYVTPRPRKRLHIVWRRGERVRRPFRKGPSGNRGNGPLHSCNSGCTSGCGHDHVARRGHGWSAIYVQALALNGVRHEGFFVQAFAGQSRARCEICEYPYGVTPGSNSCPGPACNTGFNPAGGTGAYRRVECFEPLSRRFGPAGKAVNLCVWPSRIATGDDSGPVCGRHGPTGCAGGEIVQRNKLCLNAVAAVMLAALAAPAAAVPAVPRRHWKTHPRAPPR